MYQNFEKILISKGLKAADVSKATGIAQSTLSDWKSGKSTPKTDKLIKIAAFLETTVEALME